MSERTKSTNARRRSRYATATAVGAFVPEIARPALEANGFPSASLITDWPVIIGPEYAGFTRPERLAWPRRVFESDDDDSRARNAQDCATMILRVDGPRALEVQHAVPQLIERINTFFGYRAIGRIKIVQGPVRRRPKTTREQRRSPTREAGDIAADIDLSGIEDQGLREAVQRLGALVTAPEQD